MRTVETSAGKRAEAGRTADGRTFRVGAPGPWQRMSATTILVAMKKLLPNAPACCKINAPGDVAQQVRALRSHRRGRGFEPLHSHQSRDADATRSAPFLESKLRIDCLCRDYASTVLRRRHSFYILSSPGKVKSDTAVASAEMSTGQKSDILFLKRANLLLVPQALAPLYPCAVVYNLFYIMFGCVIFFNYISIRLIFLYA